MKLYTWALVVVTLLLGVVMAWAGKLSWESLGNNLLVGLICALLTATVFTWVIEKDRRRMDGLWASEAIFLPMIDVKQLIVQAARWLLDDDPLGVEASEKWLPIAEDLARRREALGSIFDREILLAVVELESELRRVEFVTARGEDSRKDYAKDLFSLWKRYLHLMDRMLVRPPVLSQLQEKYSLTENGLDRAEDQAIRKALVSRK
jgi:hypothetical protein